MTTFYLNFLTFSLLIYISFAHISDKRLCADSECKTPLSNAKALRRYFSPDEHKLSFDANQDIVVYSKSAGSDESLWGVEINGKRGYVPKHLIRETKMLIKPTLLVDTETANIPSKPQVPLKEEKVNPSKVKQNYEVIDGTTIYTSPGGEDEGEEGYTTEKSTDPLTNTDTDHSNEKINIPADVSNSEDPKETVKAKVGNTSETKDSLQSENSRYKSEKVEEIFDVKGVQEVEKNPNQNDTVQNTDSSIESQQKTVSESSEINTVTEDFEENENEVSEESGDEDQDIMNPFSFMSNALRDVLGSDGSLEKNVVEDESEKQISDDQLNSTEINKSDSKNEKLEEPKQEPNADVSSINPESNSPINVSTLQNEILLNTEMSVEESTPSNSEQELGNSTVGSATENIPIDNSDILEKPAFQESATEESSFFSPPLLNVQTEGKTLAADVVSEVRNTENSTNEENLTTTKKEQDIGNFINSVGGDIPDVLTTSEGLSNDNSKIIENLASQNSTSNEPGVFSPTEEKTQGILESAKAEVESEVKNTENSLNKDTLTTIKKEQDIGNSLNSVGNDIPNVPTTSESLSNDNSNIIENLASQNFTSNESEKNKEILAAVKAEVERDVQNTENSLNKVNPTPEKTDQDIGNLSDSVKSDVPTTFESLSNNNPNIIENLVPQNLTSNEAGVFNPPKVKTKEIIESGEATVESDVLSHSDSVITDKPSSSESVTSENDSFNAQSSKIEDQNVFSKVESDIPSAIENSSVEIISEPEERPLVVEKPPENKNDMNEVVPSKDEEKNSGISAGVVSTYTDVSNNEKERYIPQPTDSAPYHDNNFSKEQNNIQDNNIPSYNPISSQEIPNVNVFPADSILNHEQVQNVQASEFQVENTGQNENIDSGIEAETVEREAPSIFSFFGGGNEEKPLDNGEVPGPLVAEKSSEITEDLETQGNMHEGDYCTKENCPNEEDPPITPEFLLSMDLLNFSSDVFLYLVTTAVSVIIFLLGHFALDKSRREGPLLIKINKLEKEFLILLKEKEILTNQIEKKEDEEQHVDSEEFVNLKQEKEMLEEKVQYLEENVQTLEKELENSTEIGLELNRMLSEVLNSENSGQTMMLNIEGLQAQLLEQQDIVSSMKEVLSLKETENHELNLELDIANKKVLDLQTEVDKLLSNMIKLEENKELIEKNTESQIIQLNSTISSIKEQLSSYQKEYTQKIEELNNDLSTSQHNLQLKTKEFEGLKNSMQQIKDIKNANTLESLFEVNSIKAELEQLKTECQGHCDRLRKEKETNTVLEKKLKSTEEEIDSIKTKFDETDKTRLELETKLQVLTNYFKEKEEQLQKELSKYESMWSAKQGAATSTSEKIKYLQGEVQNYKAQNETLKQEIVSQEVELKGQISVLEKKVHENWVSARQAERRLEELKQEAAQLRNRLTLRERALQDDRLHNRMQSPLEQSGDLPTSPLHLESPASPPLLYNSRDHITKSPPILGMPPPFLPPPTGSSFLPPPPPTGGSYLPPPPLPFMPPPPHDMFPGDRRPPPLGRMSSPPLNSRYSPSRPYSPYDRSPSPSYDESEYGTSPVHRRNYSQFNRRRDHRPAAMEKFNGRSGTLSSGSENSNESLDEINHQTSKV